MMWEFAVKFDALLSIASLTISYGDFNISLSYIFHVANSLSLIMAQNFNKRILNTC